MRFVVFLIAYCGNDVDFFGEYRDVFLTRQRAKECFSNRGVSLGFGGR